MKFEMAIITCVGKGNTAPCFWNISTIRGMTKTNMPIITAVQIKSMSAGYMSAELIWRRSPSWDSR